ncbi:transcriptional regulator [Kitasatospora sp. NPDC051170]|uniref:transcriptional regulator n=1 Tax=Kitasatospora sp. NPDC051170 TaxID=3364056 RepID=UPI0037A7C83E
MHRLLAAILRGQETIEVEFFEGGADDAFLRSVEMNVTHGLPLSTADRKAAAERIVASHPYMSDRAIARAAGLGPRTVASIRQRSAGAVANVRVGQDGKLRPLSGAEGRQRAAELIAERPEASLREVARLAGISPATVSDVRRRLAVGEPPAPVPAGRAALPERSEAEEGPGPYEEPDMLRVSGDAVPARGRRGQGGRRVRLVQSDPVTLLEKLVRDPSLRHKEEGRQLLRLLQQNVIGAKEWSELISVVPPHCGALVVDLARQCAETWREFAQELDQRVGRSLTDSQRSSAS